MDYRVRKQITIAAIYILIFALLGAGFYFVFLKPKPTCSDGILNQEEEEIDCGGPCVSCEILTLKDIEMVWAKAILIEGNSYDLAARIRNPNPNFGTSDLKYRFETKDRNGQLIDALEGTTFILPGDSKYIIETNFEASQSIASLSFEVEKIGRSSWQKLKDYQTPDLFVKDKNFTILNQPGVLAAASGVVKNDTDFDLDKVYVNIVLFDKYNQVIGASKTEMRALVAGENRYFSLKWFSPLTGEVSSVDMETQTNLFLDENYMRKYGVPEAEQ